MSAKIILLVDDEDSIRVFVKAILVRQYDVLEAANGNEALAIVKRVNGAVDLLVTDIRMPGMNGYELAEVVRRSYPSLPVVYISGYVTNEDLTAHNQPQRGEAFLAKHSYRRRC